jgi:hypothetical protein
MLTITVWLTKLPEDEYKYIIQNHGFLPYAAYKTKRGFMGFMKRCGLAVDKDMTKIIKGAVVDRFNFKTFRYEKKYCEDARRLYMVCKPRTVIEKSFRETQELPDSAIPFMGLSNGEYMMCYYEKTNECTIIYHPLSEIGENDDYDIRNHIALSEQLG